MERKKRQRSKEEAKKMIDGKGILYSLKRGLKCKYPLAPSPFILVKSPMRRNLNMIWDQSAKLFSQLSFASSSCLLPLLSIHFTFGHSTNAFWLKPVTSLMIEQGKRSMPLYVYTNDLISFLERLLSIAPANFLKSTRPVKMNHGSKTSFWKLER